MTESTSNPTTLVGQKAPDFDVQGYFKGELKSFKLSDYKGQWVYMLFYPLDFTFVCPTEVLSFSGMAAEFKERKCQVFGVSVDSQFTHKAWVETGKAEGGLGGSLEYPLLADLNKTVTASYGVKADAGVALRGLFLIDKLGVVRHALVNDLPLGRNVDEALRILDALQFTEEHGEVCPANWRSGEEAMKPTPDGVASYLAKHAV